MRSGSSWRVSSPSARFSPVRDPSSRCSPAVAPVPAVGTVPGSVVRQPQRLSERVCPVVATLLCLPALPTLVRPYSASVERGCLRLVDRPVDALWKILWILPMAASAFRATGCAFRRAAGCALKYVPEGWKRTFTLTYEVCRRVAADCVCSRPIYFRRMGRASRRRAARRSASSRGSANQPAPQSSSPVKPGTSRVPILDALMRKVSNAPEDAGTRAVLNEIASLLPASRSATLAEPTRDVVLRYGVDIPVKDPLHCERSLGVVLLAPQFGCAPQAITDVKRLVTRARVWGYGRLEIRWLFGSKRYLRNRALLVRRSGRPGYRCGPGRARPLQRHRRRVGRRRGVARIGLLGPLLDRRQSSRASRRAPAPVHRLRRVRVPRVAVPAPGRVPEASAVHRRALHVPAGVARHRP